LEVATNAQTSVIRQLKGMSVHSYNVMISVIIWVSDNVQVGRAAKIINLHMLIALLNLPLCIDNFVFVSTDQISDKTIVNQEAICI
jgi:hypothetical protein